MTKHFKSVIEGFSDTLPFIAKCTGKKGKGHNKLENLANSFGINAYEAHNAIFDVQILLQVLMKATLSWDTIEKKSIVSKGSSTSIKQLDSLKTCTTYATRKSFNC